LKKDKLFKVGEKNKMIIDRFTKFILSIIAFSLCLNALNPWISPTLANANDNFAMERTIKKIAGGINKVADYIGKMVEIEAERFERPIFEGQNPIRLSIACSKGEKTKQNFKEELVCQGSLFQDPGQR